MAVPKKKPTKAPKKTPPDMSGAMQPSTRTLTTWTPELIRSAEAQAENGSLRYAANLCEWLLADDRVSSTLRTRVQNLLGLDPTFERSGDKRRSGRAVKALEVGEDWWAAYPESELSRMLTWGLLLGVQPALQQWLPVEGHAGRRLPVPKCWHPQHLRFDWASREWRINVASSGLGGYTEETLVPGDGSWILHTPFGEDRPWSMGLWRALAPLVLLKHYARQDWAQISERGVLLVLTCLDAAASEELDGYTKDARRQLATDIYARGKQGVAALPPGIDLKAIQSAVKSQDIQGALIEMANEAIAIVVRGGNLTTNVAEGSRAAIEEQSRQGDLGNLRFDALALTTTIHDQSLTWWAAFNFGDQALAPWPVYPVEPKADLKAKAETTEKALGNLDTAEKLGLDVDRKLFLEEHEITWAAPGERPPEPPPVVPSPDDPAGGEGSADDEPDVDADGKPIPSQARALAFRATTEPTDNGQAYADKLARQSARIAAKELAPTVAAMVAAVRNAGSYEEAREAVLRSYGKLAAPTELASLTEAALVMAQLGGRLAVREEVPELDE